MTLSPTFEAIRMAPKVLLHDHLDGGLRPQTVVELAKEVNYRGLPTYDADDLAAWFTQNAEGTDLDKYLEAFHHTTALMQTPEALARVAQEAAQDLAADGVVYAEVRFAPELHLEGRLNLNEVVEAVLAGFAAGSAKHPITVVTLLGAMRTAANSTEIAELALRYRDAGVGGFDIAGPEAGFPPSRHMDAFQLVQRANFHTTIHAGEGFGLPSIWEALQWCNADRLGHGVRIVDDITIGEDGEPQLGRLAAFIRDKRIPLEMCPTSNVHTGICPSIELHPIKLLADLKFRVTVNTDNRLMSNTSLSHEFHKLVQAFNYGWNEIEWFNINAAKSAFWPFEKRYDLINNVLLPGFAAIREREQDQLNIGEINRNLNSGQSLEKNDATEI